MNCPVCNKNLKTVNFENQEIDICQRCGGIWFDKGELLKIVTSLINKNKIDPQTVKEAYRRQITDPIKLKQLLRKCPKCNIDMKLYNYSYDSNIFLDKCSQCNGIWTDRGEMKAVAKYIKGNPHIDGYSRELVKACRIFTKQGTGKNSKIIAVIISLLYIGMASFTAGLEGFFRILLFLIFPLACIFFGEELGGLTGVRFGLSLFRPVITKPTPAPFVVFMGWILLLFPIIFAILSAVGVFN